MNQEGEAALVARRYQMGNTVRRFAPVLALLCHMVAAGCGSDSGVLNEPAEGGHASVAIPLSKVAAASIASGEVVVSATDMSDLRQALIVSGSLVTGTVTDIPAGKGRLFTLNAYDASGVMTYTGGNTADVVAGERVRVEVTLRPVSGTSGQLALALRGTPLVVQGDDYEFTGWSPSSVGNDARITGEIANTGERAAGVTITVTLRDPSENLLGRVRNHEIGTIGAGDSELFAVVIPDVFSEYNIVTSTYQVEVEIHQ
jgi:hypothetical protein